jgi:hypothetical protein
MSEKKERKRTLFDIVVTTGVGTGMLTNVVVVTKHFYEIGEKVAPKIQEYVGSLGSGIIEYGLPTIAFGGALSLVPMAVKAIDQYLLNKKQDTEPNL